MSEPRRAARRVTAWVLAAILASCHGGLAWASSARQAPADTVVLVSVDGMRWDDPARAGARNLARMAREGASAGGLEPCFPASTFPAHATLATGVFPDKHGILNNEFLDRVRGVYRMEDDPSWLLAEPIWVTAERQGLPAAIYHWVFSHGPWHGMRPTRSFPFSRDVSDARKVDRLVSWLGERGPDRPRLILSYLHGVDAAGHREGPGSPAVIEGVRRIDRLLGRLLAAAERCGRRVSILVVSDHGMASVRQALGTERLVRGGARRVRALSTGATCNVYCPDAGACAAAASAARAIPGLEIFTLDGLPGNLRYRMPSRTGDLVLIAPAGSYFAARPEEDGGLRGMHGYRPDMIEMRGIFYAWGAGLRGGAHVPLLGSVDVEPLVCRLLGIDPPPEIDGRVPADLLTGTAPSPAPPRFRSPPPVPRPSPPGPRTGFPPGRGNARP